MIIKKFTVQNKLGIHARPAGLLVKTCSRYKSSVYIANEGNEVNAKSIMGVLMLGAAFGSEIQLTVDGDDEDQAISALEELIMARKFDEE